MPQRAAPRKPVVEVKDRILYEHRVFGSQDPTLDLATKKGDKPAMELLQAAEKKQPGH